MNEFKKVHNFMEVADPATREEIRKLLTMAEDDSQPFEAALALVEIRNIIATRCGLRGPKVAN